MSDTEICKACGFEIEKGSQCPFCPPAETPAPVEDVPPPVEDVKPKAKASRPVLTDAEKLARVEQAYLEGKMTREQYEKNVVKFSGSAGTGEGPSDIGTGDAGRKVEPESGPATFERGSYDDIPVAPELERPESVYEDDPDPDNECLSCGHRMGTRESCPRCAAKQTGRISEKKVIAVSMVLLLIGAAYMGAAGIYSETTITKIGDIRESDNFRQTRVVGQVVDVPDFYKEKYSDTGILRMLIDDGTGQIWIRVVSSVTEKLVEDGVIPGFGDTVDAEGALFVGDEGYMQIKVRDHNLFRIEERNYTQLDVSDLVPPQKSDYEVGQLVSVNGRIVDKFYIDGFAWIFDLADDEGNSVSVFVPETIMDISGDLDIDAIFLSEINMKGALEWYEGGQEWEIIPGRVSDFEIISPYTGDTYILMTVGDFLSNATAYENQYVQVENVTVEWRYEDWLFSVSDSSTSDELSVFVDYDANASINIQEGDRMSVRGWVTYYDSNDNGVPDFDEWEIKVRASSSDYALFSNELGGGD